MAALSAGKRDHSARVRELHERCKPVTHTISDGKVDGVIAIPRIEGSVVGLDTADRSRDRQVRISIAIAMRVGGEIILKEKVADLEEWAIGSP